MLNNREKALELLGEYAYNSKTKSLLEGRVFRTMEYIYWNKGKQIGCKVNNNWINPPKGLINAKRVGGTTYQYQVWIGIID